MRTVSSCASPSHLTVDERRQIKIESRKQRDAFRRTLPEELRGDTQAVSRAMMQAQFDDGTVYGKWRDVWYKHPLPTMNEPNKAVCALTPLDGVPDEHKADLFLQAGLATYRQHLPDYPASL